MQYKVCVKHGYIFNMGMIKYNHHILVKTTDTCTKLCAEHLSCRQ